PVFANEDGSGDPSYILFPRQGTLLETPRLPDRHRFIEERVPVANDGLGKQRAGLRAHGWIALYGRAYGHDLHQAPPDLVNEHLDADDAIGLEDLGLFADMRQTILACFVDEPRHRIDFAARQRLK